MNYLASSIRTSVRTIWMPPLRRTFSLKPAEFITISAQGSMTSRNVNVWLGEPHQAFVLLPTDIGNAMKVGCAWQDGLCLVADPQIYTLTFYHDTQHFAHSELLITESAVRLNLILALSRIDPLSPNRNSSRPPSPIRCQH